MVHSIYSFFSSQKIDHESDSDEDDSKRASSIGLSPPQKTSADDREAVLSAMRQNVGNFLLASEDLQLDPELRAIAFQSWHMRFDYLGEHSLDIPPITNENWREILAREVTAIREWLREQSIHLVYPFFHFQRKIEGEGEVHWNKICKFDQIDRFDDWMPKIHPSCNSLKEVAERFTRLLRVAHCCYVVDRQDAPDIPRAEEDAERIFNQTCKRNCQNVFHSILPARLKLNSAYLLRVCEKVPEAITYVIPEYARTIILQRPELLEHSPELQKDRDLILKVLRKQPRLWDKLYEARRFFARDSEVLKAAKGGVGAEEKREEPLYRPCTSNFARCLNDARELMLEEGQTFFDFWNNNIYNQDTARGVLGFSSSDRIESSILRSCFQKHALVIHPDKNPQEQKIATVLFQCLNAAYETVSQEIEQR